MKLLLVAIAIVCKMFGQAPAFEVASVKPCTEEQQRQFPIGLFAYPGGRLRVTNETLRQLIHDAYGLEMHQILGGPAWLDSERWIVEAKAPEASAGKPEMRLMLQTLLANRFGLKIHRETKTESVYALVVAKGGPKLKPPKDSTRAPFVGFGRTGPVTAEALSQTFSGQNATMDLLAYRLSQHLRRPVTNKTGIEGNFDFLIEYSGADSQTTAPPLDRAIQDQVGLRLVTEPGSVEVIVVDGAAKPSAN